MPRESAPQERRYDPETEEWLFFFSGDMCLQVSAAWRLRVAGQIRLGWKDDGHPFGLPKPVDASERLPMDAPVIDASVAEDTGDLTPAFESGILEVFNDSAGYEGWTLNGPGPNTYIVAQGGGGIVRSE